MGFPLGMPLFIGPTELIILLVLVLIIVGPGKLPEVAKAAGQMIKGLKESQKDPEEETKDSDDGAGKSGGPRG